MNDMKLTKKYTFTVEGQTEKLYFIWLQQQINAHAPAAYHVVFDVKVQQHPLKFAKRVNVRAVPTATHICDIEANDAEFKKKFQSILQELDNANKMRGIEYKLGYSNFSFELWLLLHKTECSASFAHRTQYLPLINSAFNEQFENLDQYKNQKAFERCLSKLTLGDVQNAIRRAKKIMSLNEQNGKAKIKYHGFVYFPDNPSLTVWETVERVFSDCKI